MSAAPGQLVGVCHVVYCFDIGFAVNLDALASRLKDASRVRAVRVRRPSPAWFDYEPAPVGAHLASDPIRVGDWTSEPGVDVRAYDFGAVAIRYRVAFAGDPETLVGLGVELYDHEALLADAHRHVEHLVRAGGDAIERAKISEHVEDYAVYVVDSFGEQTEPRAFVERHAGPIVRMLHAEPGPIAPDRAARTLEQSIAYATSDLAIIDWNAAILFDPDPEDTLSVLTHANIELMEARWLDAQLDELLDRAHPLLAKVNRKSVWPGSAASAELRRFAELQADSALLFEGVNNAIKLIGDQHLARVYQVASSALNLPQWDANVLRKLSVAESIYQKMSDTISTHRLEALEWIIIILILISIVMPFLGIKY